MAGGWVMWPILAVSALTAAIIVERFWSLRRAVVLPAGLGDDVREWAARRKLDPAHVEVLRANSPLGELLAAALDVRHRPREVIKERVEDVGRHEIGRASCRERVCQYGELSVGAVPLKKKKN